MGKLPNAAKFTCRWMLDLLRAAKRRPLGLSASLVYSFIFSASYTPMALMRWKTSCWQKSRICVLPWYLYKIVNKRFKETRVNRMFCLAISATISSIWIADSTGSFGWLAITLKSSKSPVFNSKASEMVLPAPRSYFSCVRAICLSNGSHRIWIGMF